MEAIIRTQDRNAFNSLILFLKSLHFEVETVKEKKRIVKKTKDIEFMNDDAYRDIKFAELLKEGRKSRIVSEEETKKEFKKRGITI